jgi:hypothetical protein
LERNAAVTLAAVAIDGLTEKKNRRRGAWSMHAPLLPAATLERGRARVLNGTRATTPRAERCVAIGTRVLKAIANSGYDGALPHVLPYLNDDREEVRKAAVRSLQSMRTSDVDSLIAERMQADVSKDVRLSALAAARLRKPGIVLEKALVATGASAEEPHVRYRAVELMAKWLPDRPELRETLGRVPAHVVSALLQMRCDAGEWV